MDSLKIVEFDEGQKAAISKALMAIAQTISDRNGEVIELLSDSDCEVIDFEGNDDHQQHTAFNPSAKLQQECFENNIDQNVSLSSNRTESTIPPQILAELHAVVVDYEKEHSLRSEEKANESQCELMELASSSDTSNKFELELKTNPAMGGPSIIEQNINYLEENNYEREQYTIMDKTIELSNDRCLVENLPIQAVFPETTPVPEHTITSTEQDNNCEYFVKAELEEVELKEYKYTPTIDEIIELGSDSEMDEETEKQVISLIESDDEESTKQTTNMTASKDLSQTLDMMIHWICPKCEHPCGNFKKWKLHVDRKHDFRNISQFNLQTEIDESGTACYKCKDCSKLFIAKTVQFSMLLKHWITHLSFSNYLKCRLCHIQKNSSAGIRHHLLHDHSKICRHYLRKKTVLWHRHLDFYCPSCNKQMTDHQDLKLHLEEVHDYKKQLSGKVKIIDENVAECIECQNRFRHLRIRLHALTHEPFMAYRCKLCGVYSTNSATSCFGHIQAHLLGTGRKYKCCYCDLSCNSARARNLHMRQEHRLKPIKCKDCTKTFGSASMLLSHMRKIHQKLL